MSTNTKAIGDTAKRIAEQPWLTRAERDRMAADIAKAIHDAVMAERERFSRATPEMIAAAWATWKPRNPKSLGPGPGFVEAINAALAAAPKSEG